MDTPSYIDVVHAESARFLAALERAELSRTVPSCPDWDGHDLAWHLAEVQHFWGAIVDRLIQDPAERYEEPSRPPDDELLGMVRDSSAALVAALRARSPDDRCWSWHPDGETVGWTARRQAHEALIHRVDAELLAGGGISPVDVELAVDGVAEVVDVMLGGMPEWATFTPDGGALTLVATDADERWTIGFGRFTGESPDSGRTYDLDDAQRIDGRPTGTTVSGTAWDLDLWMWGRVDESALQVSGDASLVRRLRTIAVEATQ